MILGGENRNQVNSSITSSYIASSTLKKSEYRKLNYENVKINESFIASGKAAGKTVDG